MSEQCCVWKLNEQTLSSGQRKCNVRKLRFRNQTGKTHQWTTKMQCAQINVPEYHALRQKSNALKNRANVPRKPHRATRKEAPQHVSHYGRTMVACVQRSKKQSMVIKHWTQTSTKPARQIFGISMAQTTKQTLKICRSNTSNVCICWKLSFFWDKTLWCQQKRPSGERSER